MWVSGGYTWFALSRRSVGLSVRLQFRTITPLLMEGFPSNFNDTLTSTRGCAEPMLPMCQLKVKVTVKAQILNKHILNIMSCPLYKPYTNGRISFKFEWHIHLNLGMCRALVAHVSAQGQGHS